MMDLKDLVDRHSPPIPWAEGDNIPWNEPGFSSRMLKEHLSQAHDAASRRSELIDRHVAWIHSQLLLRTPSRILDLGCGPGLYAQRLAPLGHTVHGIDYSPASIEYALQVVNRHQLTCTFTCQDIRQAVFPREMDLVMLIYGEFNVFRRQDAEMILSKACAALSPGGRLLLEPHPYSLVKRLGQETPSWYSSPGGLFSDHPHLVLQENFWDADLESATMRYFVIDASSRQVTRYAQSMQAYQDEGYRAMLNDAGFREIEFLPPLPGGGSMDLCVITALKPG